MHRAPMTHAAFDVGSRLMEIFNDITRYGRYHGLLSLAVIDLQGQMLWLTLKTDWAGMVLHDPPMAGPLERVRCPPMHPSRSWRQNLHTCTGKPYAFGICSRKSSSTRD